MIDLSEEGDEQYHKTYDPRFKLEVARMVVDQELSVLQVTRDRGVSEKMGR